jgi:serine/threonine-protein kinase
VPALPRIPGYDVLERLGSGGMGDVYRAISLEDRRPVALKIEGEIVALDTQSGLRERFLREARILQGLHHENLPRFYAAGELPDGRLYIAMELLVGRPLSRFARAKLEDLVPLLIQAASALRVVSESGVVHRDVSPDNFFVVEAGGRSVVKLIDFGISRDVEADRDGLTRAGSFVGKPAYCSPEQTGLRPDAGPVDWRTDLYSFGLTLHFLLRGTALFPQGNLVELLRARLKELPGETFREIPDERLRRLVARLLRLDPEDRPESFEEVVAELLHVQADLTAAAARRMEDSWKLRRKTAGRGGRIEPAPAVSAGPAPAEEPARPETAAPAPPLPPRRAQEIPIRRAVGPRTLLVVSAALIAAVFLLFLVRGNGTRSLEASGLIVLAISLAAIAAIRERGARRASDRGRSSAGAESDENPPEYAGDPTSGDPLPFFLRVTGDGPERTVRVVRSVRERAATIRIGRSVGPDDIFLATKTVSAVQALLLCSTDGCRIENASRTNPTRVNSHPLASGERRLLRDGDRIEIAAVTLHYRSAVS